MKFRTESWKPWKQLKLEPKVSFDHFGGKNFEIFLVSPRKSSIDIGVETSFKSPEIHAIAQQNGHDSPPEENFEAPRKDFEENFESAAKEKNFDAKKIEISTILTPKSPKATESPATAARRSLFYSEEESITMDEDKITVSRDELTSSEHDLDYCRIEK